MLASISDNSQSAIPQAAPPTVLLLTIARLLGLSLYWVNEQTTIGERTARYRKYYEGDHDLGLSNLMMKMLNIKEADGGFTTNFMPTVVDTMADRCIVQSIEGIEAAGTGAASKTGESGANAITKWAQSVADENDFDVLQGDVHSGTIRDANGYVMVGWDNAEQCVRYTYEPAWDGQTGMLMVYPSHNINKPSMAIKVWQIDGPVDSGASLSITTRMNVYYPNKVDKFIAKNFDMFEPYTDDKELPGVWAMKDNSDIGIPVVHFRNGGRENYGISELRNALGPQNALNRFHASSVMAAELTAFDIYIQIGFERDTDAVLPGMIVKIPTAPKDSVVDFKKLGGSDIAPILAMIDSERRLISEITRTPSPDLAAGSGSNKSGEYLKQLEVGLIGKVKRFTARAGSSWEQVFDLAHRVQTAFGTELPPAYERFVCNWQSPEVRNDAVVVANAMLAEPVMGVRQTLRNLAPIYELTETKIDEIIQEKQAAAAEQAKLMSANKTPGSGDNGGPPPFMPGRPAQQAAEMSRI